LRLGRFEAWDVLYMGLFETWDVLELGRFVVGRFVGVPNQMDVCTLIVGLCTYVSSSASLFLLGHLFLSLAIVVPLQFFVLSVVPTDY
jgi:hypothetical protein